MVNNAYCMVLQKCPDPAGFAMWKGMYSSGKSIQAVVAGLANSTDFYIKQVQGKPNAVSTIYMALVGHAPDPSKH